MSRNGRRRMVGRFADDAQEKREEEVAALERELHAVQRQARRLNGCGAIMLGADGHLAVVEGWEPNDCATALDTEAAERSA